MGDKIQFEENDNLLDQDDALDCLLYYNMAKETRGTSKTAGCLTSLAVMVSIAGSLCIAVIFAILY